MEYSSKAVGNAALTTGIIGTSLGAIASAGGLANILGVGSQKAYSTYSDPGDRPVTRYEMELHERINEKNNELAILKAAQYTDAKDAGLQAQINQQQSWISASTATMGTIAHQIHELYGMTKLMIPNDEVLPASSGS